LSKNFTYVLHGFSHHAPIYVQVHRSVPISWLASLTRLVRTFAFLSRVSIPRGSVGGSLVTCSSRLSRVSPGVLSCVHTQVMSQSSAKPENAELDSIRQTMEGWQRRSRTTRRRFVLSAPFRVSVCVFFVCVFFLFNTLFRRSF